MTSLMLTPLTETFAICRMDASDSVPEWAMQSAVFSITRIGGELSIVCRQQDVPDGVASEKGWRCLSVEGPLDFQLTGVLASLAAPLADAGVSIFAVSTFETDHLLVKQEKLPTAIEALRRAGHTIAGG